MTGQLDRGVFTTDAYPHWIDDPTTPPRACTGIDPAVFYPDHGDAAGAAHAKAICDPCAARTICKAWALSRPYDEVHGIWGGMSRRDRKRALRRNTDRTDTEETR